MSFNSTDNLDNTFPSKLTGGDEQNIADVNAQNELRSRSRVHTEVDSANSTSVPLLAGGIFYGPWTERKDPELIVAPYADKNFSYYIQFANTELSTTLGQPVYTAGQAAGIDSSLSYKYIAGNVVVPRRLVIARQWYRIVIINTSSENMAELRFQTSTGEFAPLASKLNTNLDMDADAEVVRSIIAGQEPNGEYQNLRKDGYNDNFTNTVPLLNGEEFDSGIIRVDGYQFLINEIVADQKITLQGTWYDDELGSNIIRTFSFPYVGDSSLVLTGTTMLSRYLRYKLINDSGLDCTISQLRVRTTNTPYQSQLLPLEAFVPTNVLAVTNRSIQMGRNPDGRYENASIQGIHSGNSTSVPLDANTTYRGEWFPLQDTYIKAITSLTSDVSGILYIDVTNADNPTDGVDTDIQGSLIFAYNPATDPIFRRQSPIQARWARHRYINGPAAQAVFNLQAAFVTTDPGIPAQPLRNLPNTVMQAGIVRSVPAIPAGDNLTYKDIPIDSETKDPTNVITKVRDDLLDRPLSSMKANQIVVGTTATRLDPAPLNNRRAVMISNDGATPASVGFSNSITFNSDSFRLSPGAVRSMMAAPSVEFWAITQDTGGTQTTYDRSGSSAAGTATSPSNVLISDDIRASIDANTETIEITGFTAGTTNDLVSVKLEMEARKQSGQTETVVIEQVEVGTTTGAGTVSTASPMAGGTDQLYVAYIARNSNTNTITQVQVDGVFMIPIVQNISNGSKRIDVWYVHGDILPGVVTASMSTNASAHIAVYRISNADAITPIEDSGSTTGSGTSVSGPSISGTNKGLSLLGILHGAVSGTAGVSYTENADLSIGTGSNRTTLGAESKSLTATGTEAGTYTISSADSWATIGVTIFPKEANNPKVELSYELSAVPGVTSGIIDIGVLADTTYEVDVTGDRAWIPADIANMKVIATGDTISAAAAEVDHLYIRLVDTTGSVTRISLIQGGEDLV